MPTNTKLGSEEFEETLLDQVSTHILSDFYIDTYPEFTSNLFFSLWKEYYKDGTDLPVRHYADMVEIFFMSLFTYPSSAEKDNEYHGG